MMAEKMFAEMKKFYQKVDKEAGLLNKIHQERLNCMKGCFECCTDDISVFEVEA